MKKIPWTDNIPLIGLGYRAGSGKDTVGDYLVRKHGYAKFSFARALKRMANVAGFTEEQVNGTLEQKETVDPFWGFTPRWFLQRLGTEVGRAIDPHFWIKCLERELRDVDPTPRQEHREDGSSYVVQHPFGVVITDVRFPNELGAIRAWGGVTVEIYRPEAYDRPDTHSSETALKDHVFDMRLPNRGTLEELYANVDAFLKLVDRFRKAGE